MNSQVKRNYLEINSINELIEKEKPLNNLYLYKVDPPDFQLNKFFYKEVGKKHRWVDRLIWTDKTWNNYLNKNGVNTYVLKHKQDLVGYFEQNYYKSESNCEIAYFGILEEYIGKKSQRFLLFLKKN